MPANDALLASLLIGQRQRTNPLEERRKYGQSLMQQGASTAPLGSGSPWEGIARALQGGVGGFFAGQADREEQAQDQNNIDVLSKATTAGSPEAIAAALKGLKGNGEMVIPVLGQIIQSNLDQRLAQQKAGNMLPQYGMGTPAAGATASPQTAAATTPGVPQPGYSLDNNPGNIRASAIPWDGKGQPQNGFETYNSPQAGANAQFKNFAAYVQANPNITVAQAIAQWSPPNENNTNGVIKSISEATGINPAMPLAEVLKDPAMAATLLDAQTRLEKGKMPPGYTADTFMQATGGPQAAPGVPGPVAQAPAQGSGPTPAPQQAANVPTAMSSPAGDQLRQRAQQAQQQGDNVTALKFAQEAAQEDAKWATEVGKINLQGVEHDRQQNTATPNNEQALSSGFADRMTNSGRLVEKFGAAGTELGARLKEQIPIVGNLAQSPQFQQYKQARDDFINAQLRRESGAAIAASEYANADRQYFPQPGDGPEVLAQKAKNRQLAVEGMVRNAGPAYKPSPTVGADTARPSGGGDVLGQARAAIAQGAPRDKVIERLRASGINPEGL